MRSGHPGPPHRFRRALKMCVTLAHLLLLAAVVILEGGTLIAWGRALGILGAIAQEISDQSPLVVLICVLVASVVLYRVGRGVRRHGS